MIAAFATLTTRAAVTTAATVPTRTAITGADHQVRDDHRDLHGRCEASPRFARRTGCSSSSASFLIDDAPWTSGRPADRSDRLDLHRPGLPRATVVGFSTRSLRILGHVDETVSLPRPSKSSRTRPEIDDVHDLTIIDLADLGFFHDPEDRASSRPSIWSTSDELIFDRDFLVVDTRPRRRFRRRSTAIALPPVPITSRIFDLSIWMHLDAAGGMRRKLRYVPVPQCLGQGHPGCAHGLLAPADQRLGHRSARA